MKVTVQSSSNKKHLPAAYFTPGSVLKRAEYIFLVVIDEETGKSRFVRFGHGSPIVVSVDALLYVNENCGVASAMELTV